MHPEYVERVVNLLDPSLNRLRNVSQAEAVERVLQWWTATAPSVLGKNLVVVLPGSVLSGFAAAMLGMRLSRCVSLNLPHGGLGVLDVFQNGTRVGTWNATALLK